MALRHMFCGVTAALCSIDSRREPSGAKASSYVIQYLRVEIVPDAPEVRRMLKTYWLNSILTVTWIIYWYTQQNTLLKV